MPNRIAFRFAVVLMTLLMAATASAAAQSATEAGSSPPAAEHGDPTDPPDSVNEGLGSALARLWLRVHAVADLVKLAATDVRTPRQALQCDVRRRVHSVRNEWGYLSGFDTPEAALDTVVTEGFVIPQRGYDVLARNLGSVLFGFRNGGNVKVAIRVAATETGRWIPEWLADCQLAEFGRTADMGPGVWLWANRDGRTIQERRGPAHCRQQSVRTLWWTTASGKRRDQRHYVRDPEGRFRNQWQAPYLRFTRLPNDARNTGYRRDGATIWMASDRDSIYIKDGGNVQRWPRVLSTAGCA